MEPERDVFVSHASDDAPIARAICNSLEARDIKCWIAPRDIPEGTEFPEAIIDGVNGCRMMVLVFSGSANASVHIAREAERAVHRGIPILPFRVEDVALSASLEYLISLPQWLDATTPPHEEHVPRLIARVEGLLTADEHWAHPHTPLVRLRLFIEALPALPDDVWDRVEVAEKAWGLGFGTDRGVEDKRLTLPSPEPYDEVLDAIEAQAGVGGIVLPGAWREDYWQTGFVPAIRRSRKTAVHALVRDIDDESMRAARILRTPVHMTRGGLTRKRIAGTFDQEATDLLIRRLGRLGLLLEDLDSRVSARSAREIRYRKTDLLRELWRVIDMSGIDFDQP